MDKLDYAFAALLSLISAWMALADWAQPADQVAREFVYVLGGLSGIYVLGRRWLER